MASLDVSREICRYFVYKVYTPQKITKNNIGFYWKKDPKMQDGRKIGNDGCKMGK